MKLLERVVAADGRLMANLARRYPRLRPIASFYSEPAPAWQRPPWSHRGIIGAVFAAEWVAIGLATGGTLWSSLGGVTGGLMLAVVMGLPPDTVIFGKRRRRG